MTKLYEHEVKISLILLNNREELYDRLHAVNLD